ncbi:Uu.00g053850.m01.CDS01 [Anthostomella pinea]|uniref:Uu.00g053850.m01.CDS01 n=1 Tax=Anthostomella pinea TaxID=933095 RepID=A0AAI8VX48_9PEZI|nr:Uu.00g053850.m01.CDS01 [Anthostomella pinea]
MTVRRASTFAVVIPLVLSLAGFVLAMLALFAGTGSQQQVMEDYHIIAVNMSDFGHDLIASAATTSTAPEPTKTDDGGFWSSIESGISDIGQDVKNDLTDIANNIANDVADKLADAIGISEWYSLHIMTACEGVFSPNATNPGAWFNTTNCTAQEAGLHFNLTELINGELQAGPLHLSAADLRFPQKVQDAVDLINDTLLAVFLFYVLGSAFTGLSFLVCIVLLTLRPDMSRLVILANLAISILAALTLAIGSAMTTAVAKKGVSKINDAGEDVGISAVEGTKFITISWVAFAVMFASCLFWTATCFLPRKSKNYGGEKGPRTSADSGRPFLAMFRRRH